MERGNVVREYELMLVLSPELDEEGLQAATERVRSLVAARGAEIRSLEPWGRRRLAYPIGKIRDGYYTIARFQMQPQETDELERTLKLSEPVVRHLLVRLDSR